MGLPADSPSADGGAEKELAGKMLGFYADPLGFVLFNFPWLEPGTPLENHEGPDLWQRRFLKKLGDAIRAGFPRNRAIRMAVTSGHGVGKTAVVSWIILWFMSTRPKPQVVVTANTQNQLTTKTWREVGKWCDLAINGHWFEHTATQLKMRSHPKIWFATAVPWSANNSSAFAGTHEDHVLMIMDEASEIDSVIWEVAEGAMTTPGAMWFAFGNPTINTGRFRQCWTKFRERWLTFKVDSRDAKMADKDQLQEWIDDYGIDSDFVKVRVLGEFPATGARQLIGVDTVERAMERGNPKNRSYVDARKLPVSIPRVMGVDVGSYGDAKTVIVRRQGPVMFNDIIRFREANPNTIAGRIAENINKYQPDVVFIDANGHGHGVYLILISLSFDNVIPVYAGEQDKRQIDTTVFYNKRIVMWYRMKKWLEESGAIPDDRELFEDLIAPEYEYDVRNRMRLERKENMARRGIPSPDTGDALALTFAEEVPARTEIGMFFQDASMLEPEYE